MSDAVIQVENLSKKYIIGHQKQERYTALRDVVANGVKNFARGLTGKRDKNLEDISEDFWALKDVSFEIKQGDRVGIIGRNGAGKSTLLKILSRITEPTSGKISIKGRVASLLEVGTGFHPELTGRENIYLNGAILGMDRFEIKKKFDEIVAFAEVEKFLDTPVKRYSSGMYVRLAFAVAAHLEPEILIVDEVLAVGDAQFQKKCLGKMEDVGKEGRTVLFVSHNMATIQQLCTSGILLSQGELVVNDTVESAIGEFLLSSKSLSNMNSFDVKSGVKIMHIYIKSKENGSTVNTLIFNNDYFLTIRIHLNCSIKLACVVIKVYNQLGLLVSTICSPEEGIERLILEGTVEINVDLQNLQLFPNHYKISLFIYDSIDPQPYYSAEDVFEFDVLGSIIGNSWLPYRQDHGIVRICKNMAIKCIT